MTGTKRKAPISKRAFLAFIKACLITCAALEKDTTTPRKDLFKRGEELLCEVVRETAAYTERNNMFFSPVNLFKGARWAKDGLTAAFIIVLGHFETSSLNLLGVLLAARSKKKDGLRYVGSRTRRRRRSPRRRRRRAPAHSPSRAPPFLACSPIFPSRGDRELPFIPFLVVRVLAPSRRRRAHSCVFVPLLRGRSVASATTSAIA